MNKLLALSASLGLFTLAGCGSTPPSGGTQYIDPNGQHGIVNVGKINYQDFDSAAHSLVQSLINSNAIQSKHPGKPSLLSISRIINETDQQFDTDALVSNIRIQLLQTGKIQTITTFGLGDVQDPLAKQVADKNAFVSNSSSATPVPDYTLTGKILMDKSNAGDVKQSAYIFYMTLTDVSTGTGVWEDKAPIVKQGRQSSVGF